MRATRDWFGDELVKIGKKYEQVVVVNCDLGEATKTLKFRDSFPERFFECGIAEANTIGVACGMAQEGYRPILASFGHFLTGKYLEIFQSVGLNNSGVVLVGTHAGLAIGKDGPTQMGLRDLALMRTIHNLEILHPVDGFETRQMMDYIASHQRPTYLRLCRQPLEEVHSESYKFNFGEPDVLSNGKDVVIFSMGGTIPVLLDSLPFLKEKRIDPTIVNVSSLPVNTENIKKIVSEIGQVFVVEDHFIKGGLADEIARILLEMEENIIFTSKGVADYGQAASPADLYERYQLDTPGIVNHLRKFLNHL